MREQGTRSSTFQSMSIRIFIVILSATAAWVTLWQVNPVLPVSVTMVVAILAFVPQLGWICARTMLFSSRFCRFTAVREEGLLSPANLHGPLARAFQHPIARDVQTTCARSHLILRRIPVEPSG